MENGPETTGPGTNPANDVCGGGLSSLFHRISFEGAFYPIKRPLTDAEQEECHRLFRWG